MKIKLLLTFICLLWGIGLPVLASNLIEMPFGLILVISVALGYTGGSGLFLVWMDDILNLFGV